MKKNKNLKDSNEDLLCKIDDLNSQLSVSRKYAKELKSENKSLNTKLIEKQNELEISNNKINLLTIRLSDCIKEYNTVLAKLDSLLIIEEKYNDIIKNLAQIKLDAELFSTKLIEESESQAMESINVVDDILHEINILKKDIEALKSDLRIGTLTIQDRIYNFSFCIDSFSQKLTDIKDKFYKQYNLLIKEKI